MFQRYPQNSENVRFLKLDSLVCRKCFREASLSVPPPPPLLPTHGGAFRSRDEWCSKEDRGVIVLASLLSGCSYYAVVDAQFLLFLLVGFYIFLRRPCRCCGHDFWKYWFRSNMKDKCAFFLDDAQIYAFLFYLYSLLAHSVSGGCSIQNRIKSNDATTNICILSLIKYIFTKNRQRSFGYHPRNTWKEKLPSNTDIMLY